MFQKTLIVTALGLAMSIGLSGCDQKGSDIPDGEYRVATETIENHKSLLVQKITIKTKGHGYLVHEENCGPNSMSIGPSTMSNEEYQTVNVTLIATITRSAIDNQRELVVSRMIKIPGATGYSSIAMLVGDTFSLEDLQMSADKKGDFTKKHVLLRAEHNKRYIELYIAKDLPKLRVN